MKPSRWIFFTFLFFLSAAPLLSADEIQGQATGWWSDYEGNNYYGSAPAASSDSSGSSGYAYSSAYGDAAGRLGEAVGQVFSQALKQAAETQASYAQAYGMNFQANKAMAAGNYEQAVNFYQQALAYVPNDFNIAKNLKKAQTALFNAQGQDFHKKGDWENALEAYRKALEFDPSSRSVRQNIRLVEQKQAYEKIREREDLLKAQMAQLALKIKEENKALGESLKPADPKAGGLLELKNFPKSAYAPGKGLHINKNIPLPDQNADALEEEDEETEEEGDYVPLTRKIVRAKHAVAKKYHEGATWMRETIYDWGLDATLEHVPGASTIKSLYQDTPTLYKKVGGAQIHTADAIFGQLAPAARELANPDQRMTDQPMQDILERRAKVHKQMAHDTWREKFEGKSKDMLKGMAEKQYDLEKEQRQERNESVRDNEIKWGLTRPEKRLLLEYKPDKDKK